MQVAVPPRKEGVRLQTAAGGLVSEDGDGQAAVENPGAHVVSVEAFEDLGHPDHRVEILAALVGGQQEVLPVELGLQFLQRGKLALDFGMGGSRTDSTLYSRNEEG